MLALNKFNKHKLFERLLPTKKNIESTYPFLTLNGYQLQIKRTLRNMTEWQWVRNILITEK